MSETAKNDAPRPRNPAFHGKKGRSGPARGNDNAARHYLRAGKLPPKLQYVEHRINAFRRHLEEAVAESKGEVSIVDAAAINTACKWERHGLLAQHWLRHEAENLSVDQRLKFSAEIAKASDNRDKNLRALGLDAEPAAPWDVIDAKTNGTAEPTT
jgi:hypothetical protein